MTLLVGLEAALHGADPEERRQAARRLNSLPLEHAMEPLVLALGDEDWRVRKEAVAAAIGFGPNPRLVHRLVELIGASEVDVGRRNAAVEALAGCGSPCIEVLVAALPALDADGRKLAAEALGQTQSSAALAALEQLLEDPDPNVRAAALEQIAQLGATAVERVAPILVRFLEHEEILLQITAINGLNQLGVAVPWQQLQRLLQDPMLRDEALVAAAGSGSAEAGSCLVDLLRNTEPRRHKPILRALAEYVRSTPDGAEAARRALKELTPAERSTLFDQARSSNPDVPERRDAVVLLGVLGGGDATQLAVQALTDERMAAAAANAMALLGCDAVASLVNMDSRDPATLVARLEHLGEIHCPCHSLDVAAMALPLLNAEEPAVSLAALGALASVGDASALAPVAALLPTPEARLRIAAAETLAALSRRHPGAAAQLAIKARPEAAEAHAAAIIMTALGVPIRGEEADVGFLSLALSNNHAQIRRAAVEALSFFGSERAVEAVAFALMDEEPNVASAAVRALGKMRRADGSAAGLVPLLAQVRQRASESALAETARALGDTGDPEAQAILCELVTAGPPAVAVAAVEALAPLEGTLRNAALVVAIHHPEAEVVKAAMPLLAEAPDAQVTGHLRTLLGHVAWDVRRLAADLLGQVGGDGTLGYLRQRASVEPEELVREALQRAIAELESHSLCIRRTTPPPARGSSR